MVHGVAIIWLLDYRGCLIFRMRPWRAMAEMPRHVLVEVKARTARSAGAEPKPPPTLCWQACEIREIR